MCSGRVDMGFVLRAFSDGIDGVFVGGCRLNECNYVTHGNYHALTMVLLLKKIMEHIGLNSERLRIAFMSAADGNIFAESVNDFVKTVKEIGPLGKGTGEKFDDNELKSKLAEVTKLVPYIKLEKMEKLGTRLENPEEYDTFFTTDEIEKLFTEVVSYYIDPEKCQACMTCARRYTFGQYAGLTASLSSLVPASTRLTSAWWTRSPSTEISIVPSKGLTTVNVASSPGATAA